MDITEDHKDKKEALLTKINSISKDVEWTKANLLNMKEQVTVNNAKCKEEIEARKAEICAVFDEMIQKASKVNDTIDENVKTMDRFLEDLEKIGKCETSSYEDIPWKMEMAAEIERDYQTILSNENKIQFYRYKRNNGHGHLKLTSRSDEGSDNSTGSDEEKSTDDRSVDGSSQNNDLDKGSDEESERKDRGKEGPPLKRNRTQSPTSLDSSLKGESVQI